MDKIRKFLQKLTPAERKVVENIIKKVLSHDLDTLDVKKLKRSGGFFRVRKGSIRIIFIKEGEHIRIVSIDRRSENTYKDF
mgnify:CR=1 FL=1